jgi:hypothetical protein
MIMFRLKLDRFPVSAATFKVRVAGTICPGAKLAPSWFHVRNRLRLADVGFQFDALMCRVSETLPVLRMYRVFVAASPEFRLPQSMFVQLTWACGSLKTPMLTVPTMLPPMVPVAGRFCWAMRTPAVTAESVMAMTTRAINGIRAVFFSCTCFPQKTNYVLHLNKRYTLLINK